MKTLEKILMDLFLLIVFGIACACYVACYQYATEHTLADKIGTGFLTTMTVATFALISTFTVHDD